jgi:hypothetical protein
MAHHFLNKVESHVNNAAKAVQIGHTAYQVGKNLWAASQAIAPYAAMLL